MEPALPPHKVPQPKSWSPIPKAFWESISNDNDFEQQPAAWITDPVPDDRDPEVDQSLDSNEDQDSVTHTPPGSTAPSVDESLAVTTLNTEVLKFS